MALVNDGKEIIDILDTLTENCLILKKDPTTISEKDIEILKNYGNCRIDLFANNNIINKLKLLLNLKSSNKNNKIATTSVLHVTIAVIIYNIYSKCSNWPSWIITSYLNDSMNMRLWIDAENTNLLCQNLFKGNALSLIYNQDWVDDNCNDSMEVVDEISEDKVIQDIVDSSSANTIINRYSKLHVKSVVIQTIKDHLLLNNGNGSVNFIQTCVHLIKISSIRQLVSKYLECWYKNPLLPQQVRILSMKLMKHVDIDSSGHISDSDLAVIDDVILFSNIQLKKLQTGVYRANDIFLMLKSVVIRSDIAAVHIFKTLILADYSSIGETAKLISSILKELPSLSRSLILGRSLGAACTSLVTSNGWTSQSSKIWIDASLKLLRQCENFTLLSDVGQGFFSTISNVSIIDFPHEWLLYCVDVLVIVQVLRFEIVSIEARDSVVSTNNPKKGLLKLSNQIFNESGSSKLKPTNIIVSNNDEIPHISRDVIYLQELVISWLSQISCNIRSAGKNNKSVSNNFIELIHRALCFNINPIISIDFDKKKYNFKESGFISEIIIKSISALALNLSSSSIGFELWVELIEKMVQRAIKSQQNNSATCIDNIMDAEVVILSLFSLCALYVIPGELEARPVGLLTDMSLITSSDVPAVNHPYKTSSGSDRQHLPLIADIQIYWRVVRIVYFLACSIPKVGELVWDKVPTIKNLMIMTISNDYDVTRSPIMHLNPEGLHIKEEFQDSDVGVKRKLNEIFPPDPKSKPCFTQWGIPIQDWLFMVTRDYPRVPPDDIILSIKHLDSKFNLGKRLRRCVDPDFITRNLQEFSMSNDTKWLISAVSEDLEAVLSRLTFSAALTLAIMTTVKAYNTCFWDFNEDYQCESITFLDSLFARTDDLFIFKDVKLISALILKIQSLFNDSMHHRSERSTVLHIIGSNLEHEDFDRRCICRLFLGFFSCTINSVSFDEVTCLGPIDCDFISALKTIWINLQNDADDADKNIIIDSVTNSLLSEGNLKIVRAMLQFLKWIETNYSRPLLVSKAFVLLLSTKSLTAKYMCYHMTFEEISQHLYPVISSISTLSNQANGLVSETACTDLLPESIFINVSMVDLTKVTKTQTNHHIFVQVNALRSLIMVAILHPNSYINCNSQMIQCTLSVIAGMNVITIRNYFLTEIAILRTLKNYKYCKLILQVLPIEILFNLIINESSGFSIEFMKAFIDIIDIALKCELSWDQVSEYLGSSGFTKLIKETAPLVQFFSSLSDTSKADDKYYVDMLSNLDISFDELQGYIDSSSILFQIDNHLKKGDDSNIHDTTSN